MTCDVDTTCRAVSFLITCSYGCYELTFFPNLEQWACDAGIILQQLLEHYSAIVH